MTANDGFDRHLGNRLEELAAPRVPDYLEEVLARTSRTRQRPAWTSPGRWLPVQITLRVSAVPRTAWLLLVLAVAIALVGLVAVIGGQRRLPAPFGPAKTGLLAFDSVGDIYVASADGSGRRALTSGTSIDTNPTWSPDGTKIAYWTQPKKNGLASLIVIGSDGHLISATATASANISGGAPVAWSPDSQRIAYGDGFSPGGIYVVSIDGGEPVQIGDKTLDSSDPAWSPDGKLVAFHGQANGIADGVYLMNADGTNVRQLTHAQGSGFAFAQPQWSPDGRSILFYAGDNGAHDIWVAAVDGSSERNLTNDAIDDFWPTWSPDGTQIAFESGTGSDDLFVMRADGTERRRLELPITGVTGSPPAWSPDGTKIYCYGADLNSVYVIDPSGKAPLVTIVATGNLGNGNWQRLAP